MKILVPCKPENFTNYKNALINSGLEPVNALAAFDVSEYAGLVLPGGGDIDPAYFHEQNKGSKNIDSGTVLCNFVTHKKLHESDYPQQNKKTTQ